MNDVVDILSSKKINKEKRKQAMVRLWADMRNAERRLYLIMVAELLERGDTTVGLMLDKIAYWHYPDHKGNRKLKIRRDDKYWSLITADNWFYELGLSADQVKQANKKIKSLTWKGKPLVITLNTKTGNMRGMHYRLNWEVFAPAFYHFWGRIQDMDKNISYKQQKEMWQRTNYFNSVAESQNNETEHVRQVETSTQESQNNETEHVRQVETSTQESQNNETEHVRQVEMSTQESQNNETEHVRQVEMSTSKSKRTSKIPPDDKQNSHYLNYNHHIQPPHQPSLGRKQMSFASSAAEFVSGAGSSSIDALGARPPYKNQDSLKQQDLSGGVSDKVQNVSRLNQVAERNIFNGLNKKKYSENKNVSSATRNTEINQEVWNSIFENLGMGNLIQNE